MSLIKCKECGHSISDKAQSCPHCGCPREFNVNTETDNKNLNTEQCETDSAKNKIPEEEAFDNPGIITKKRGHNKAKKKLCMIALSVAIIIGASIGTFYYSRYSYTKSDTPVYSEDLVNAANMGNSDAQLDLSKVCFQEQKLKEGFEWTKKSAEKGNTEAQAILSALYVKGVGTDVNEEEGLKWLKKASEGGNSLAQLTLAFKYLSNLNYDDGMKWLKKSASAGNNEAQVYLAEFYCNGKGVGKDYLEATKWYAEAAKNSNRKAQVWLCSFYESGDLIPASNEEELLKLYDQIKKYGDGAIEYIAAKLYYSDQTPDAKGKAFSLVEKAAKKGVPSAWTMLGLMYANGNGVERNDKKAVECFEKGAGLDDGNAYYFLAKAYQTGTVVKQDSDKAKELFDKASQKNSLQFQSSRFSYQNANVRNETDALPISLNDIFNQSQTDSEEGTGISKDITDNLYKKGYHLQKETTEQRNVYDSYTEESNLTTMNVQFYGIGTSYYNNDWIPLQDDILGIVIRKNAEDNNIINVKLTFKSENWLHKFLDEAQNNGFSADNNTLTRGGVVIDNIYVNDNNVICSSEYCY